MSREEILEHSVPRLYEHLNMYIDRFLKELKKGGTKTEKMRKQSIFYIEQATAIYKLICQAAANEQEMNEALYQAKKIGGFISEDDKDPF